MKAQESLLSYGYNVADKKRRGNKQNTKKAKTKNRENRHNKDNRQEVIEIDKKRNKRIYRAKEGDRVIQTKIHSLN